MATQILESMGLEMDVSHWWHWYRVDATARPRVTEQLADALRESARSESHPSEPLDQTLRAIARCELEDAGTTEKISWRDVPLTYGRSGSDCERIGREDPQRVELLREYRDTGSIHLGWLCTPEELADMGDDDAVSAGPRVDAIDWTGIDEA